MTTAEPDYDIFEYLEEYLLKEDLIKPNHDTYNTVFCFMPSDLPFMSKHDVMNICKKFVIFYEKLKDAYQHDTTKYSKYREYLNYWLTYKLVSIAFPDKDKPKFYEFIQSNYNLFSPDGELYGKIYHIKDSNFNNMYILYELYRLYHELEDNNLKKCKNFYEKCVENYNSALHKCYFDDPKLCNPLEKFKHFYDKTRSSMLHKCVEKGLPIIPKFVKPEASDGKKFMNKLAYYIYQLSKKQNEETHSIISNTLGFYNKQKSSVPFINLFIKEFFENYYKHNEYEYREIYKECSTNESSSTYCTVYNQCNQELGKDLFKIKDNIKTHIEYKATQSKELASKYSSGDIPMHIEGEDIVSSNTIPINIGVGVGALFTLSSLYKFTPMGSWLNKTFLGRGNNMNNYGEENGLDFFDHNSSFDNYIPENAKFNVAYNAA
ncbi:PIR Superfamily Protein [Plasmodium ovale curtisi]|uniref:PIR Superfamily Protein n=1 Tax=Plasmodium ovale curtisi TaxID=864141 RepID=A0A1A8WPJ7_PLAOA|nr:PIR Superfamily Protein [Plasmodium ovale curtisi]